MHWGDNDLLIDSFPSPVILGLGLGFLEQRGGKTEFGRVKESLFKKKRFPPTHPNLSHSHGRNIESYLTTSIHTCLHDIKKTVQTYLRCLCYDKFHNTHLTSTRSFDLKTLRALEKFTTLKFGSSYAKGASAFSKETFENFLL